MDENEFESAYAAFQGDPKEAAAQELGRQAKGVSRTLALLDKTIGRFKL